MENTKFLERMRKLTSAEFDAFILFAESPYHNKKSAIVSLLKYLKKYHPDLRGTKVAKELVCRKIHPGGGAYRPERLDVLMSQTLRLSEDFLVHEAVKQNPLFYYERQLVAFRERGLDRDFKKTVEKIDTLLAAEKQDFAYHAAKYRLCREVFYHPATPRKQKGMPSLEGTLHHLDAFFAAEKMHFAGLAFNRRRLLNEKYEILLLNAVLDEGKSIIDASPVLTFSARLLSLLQTEDSTLLQELTEEFAVLASEFGYEKGQTYLFLLLNICAIINRKDDIPVTEHIYELYEIGLKTGYLFVNGRLTEDTITGIISAACKTGRFTKATEYLTLSIDRVFPESERENIFNLGRALVEFIKAESNPASYEKTIDYLRAVRFTSTDYTYRVKSMLLRLYLTKYLNGAGDADFIEDFAAAYERQILRDKVLSKKQKDNYLRAVRVIKSMLDYQETKSEKIRAHIRKRLTDKQPVYTRKWLQKKAEEMFL